MNSQSGTHIPPEAIDMLRSHQNLVVTAGHGSLAQRQALEEIFTSTWEIGNEFLVVCSDAVFVQVTEILHELMVRTGTPEDVQFRVQPEFDRLADLDHDVPSLVLVTAKHLFVEWFGKFDPDAFPTPGYYWPSAGTILSIGLDRCADVHEAAKFEVCWRNQLRGGANGEMREIVLVEGAVNLNDLVALSRAQVVQIENLRSEWRFRSVLCVPAVGIPILKAFIASADCIFAPQCVEFLENSVFPILSHGYSSKIIAKVANEFLEHLRVTQQIWPLTDGNALYYTVFPHLFGPYARSGS